MAYIALYRKYRPRRFDDMVGQEHITRVLKKQLETGQTAHAYLFCGARGTGKTSAAKILARAVNCLDPVDGEPCGKCAVCAMGDEALSADIMEIDAASNNGVDEIRDLRDKINFAPAVCRYKVYIIDEVHMLSTGAFNALLKTLEEPPAHAKFILATTESGKIPATILSRCQRFDFKRIPQDLIAGQIKNVLADLGMGYEEDAVTAIAAAAEGGMRDALSILDQCVSLGGEVLSYQNVVETIGTLDDAAMNRLVDDLAAGKVDRALNTVEEAYLAGKDLSMVLRDLMSAFCSRMVEASRRKQPVEFYLRAIAILSDGETAMRFSQRPRTALLAAIARIALVTRDDSPEGLKARIARLEAQLKDGRILVGEKPAEDPMQKQGDAFQVPPPMMEDAPPAPEEDLPPWEIDHEEKSAPAKKAYREPTEPIVERKKDIPPKPLKQENQAEESRYGAFLEAVHQRSALAYQALCFGKLREEGEDQLTIAFDEKGKIMAQALKIPTNVKLIDEALYEVYGPDYHVVYVDAREQGKSDEVPPIVARAKAVFGTDVTITD